MDSTTTSVAPTAAAAAAAAAAVVPTTTAEFKQPGAIPVEAMKVRGGRGGREKRRKGIMYEEKARGKVKVK